MHTVASGNPVNGLTPMFYPNENNSRVQYESPGNRWPRLMKMEVSNVGTQRIKGSLNPRALEKDDGNDRIGGKETDTRGFQTAHDTGQWPIH